MNTAVAHSKSVSMQIFEIRSFPNVRPVWDRLTTDQKRAVLDELEGDITERWAMVVIKDIKRKDADESVRVP
jgi:hypothetical protein